jgi:hypothetical protein
MNEWRIEIPQEDGWYWTRWRLEDSERYEYDVHVVRLMAGWVHSVLSIEPLNIENYKHTGIEWYGPITCP